MSEREFKKIIKKEDIEFPKFSEEQLDSPVPITESGLIEDARHGKVFVFLNSEDTLMKYRSQFNFNDNFFESKNISSVFVNEIYLRGTYEQKELAKSIILIDTKGFFILVF